MTRLRSLALLLFLCRCGGVASSPPLRMEAAPTPVGPPVTATTLPIAQPSAVASATASLAPVAEPSAVASATASLAPVAEPSAVASATASLAPVAQPSAVPSMPPDLALAAGMTSGVVHRSETYASVIARNGKIVRVAPLLTTSDVPLAAGTKGVLLRKVPAGEGEEGGEWAILARVVLKKMDAQSLELTLEDERPTPNKKARPYARGTSVKLRVERVE